MLRPTLQRDPAGVNPSSSSRRVSWPVIREDTGETVHVTRAIHAFDGVTLPILVGTEGRHYRLVRQGVVLPLEPDPENE